MYDILVKYSRKLLFGPHILRYFYSHNAAEKWGLLTLNIVKCVYVEDIQSVKILIV